MSHRPPPARARRAWGVVGRRGRPAGGHHRRHRHDGLRVRPRVVGDLEEPPPQIARSSGAFDPGSESDEQIVRLTDVAGDSVDVAELEIVVRATGPSLDAEAHLVDLPTDSFFSTAIGASNIEGDHIISQSNGAPNQVIVPADPNTWRPGDTIQFRIKVGGADFRKPADRTGPAAAELEVVVIHTPSGTVLVEETFTP